ncbi:acyl-CoA dehydrogenase family protein [Pigmentiphaga soli]|uniref:Acyl-CoA dehydrogenase family protein n=1 Tax=Pigmentiphaga soli TaxID=1007095 RepID=A0ABP8HGC7_9BURK
MDFRLTSEQRLLQESVRAVVDKKIIPIFKRNDPAKPLPKEERRALVKVAAAQGLTSVRIPERHGGNGMSALEYGLIREMMPASVAFGIAGQEGPALRICMGGNEEQIERYVPGLIAGDILGASGTTEPGSGSDPRGAKTRAVQDGDHWLVTGHKMWVSGAYNCDIMLTAASIGKNEKGHNRLLWLVVDQSESPFFTSKTPTMGLRQGAMGEAIFDNCRVPSKNVIGGEGTASRVLQDTWLLQRPGFGMVAVGMAQRALDAATEYAGQREMFGRKIGGFQLVQELLAESAAAVMTSRLLCYKALQAIDNDEPDKVHLSAMSKRYSIATCTRAVSLCMEVFGAMGISTELGLEELYRDIRMLPIPDGTNQILTLIEGREITGISAIR